MGRRCETGVPVRTLFLLHLRVDLDRIPSSVLRVICARLFLGLLLQSEEKHHRTFRVQRRAVGGHGHVFLRRIALLASRNSICRPSDVTQTPDRSHTSRVVHGDTRSCARLAGSFTQASSVVIPLWATAAPAPVSSAVAAISAAIPARLARFVISTHPSSIDRRLATRRTRRPAVHSVYFRRPFHQKPVRGRGLLLTRLSG